MSELLVGLTAGLLLALAGYLFVRFKFGKNGGGKTDVVVHSSIESMRSVGELSVFKIITKEIVTADKHVFGPTGKKYLNWVVSSKKMAMILTFNIDFRYDLQSAEFEINRDRQVPGRYTLKMPKCFYETHITDLTIYDEQRAEFLPILMPDLISKVFGGSFSEADKNELIRDAKAQASEQAKQLVARMRSEVQNSARQTLTALAKGFGAAQVQFDFGAATLVQTKVEYDEAA